MLYHYSDAPLVFDPSRTYKQEGNFFKPRGLWISDESEGSFGWREWCLGEQFGRLTCRSVVTLQRDANVLRVQSVSDLLEFTRTFRLNPPRYRGDDSIDWPRVVRAYAGIIITPYQWSMRNNLMWYYSWDCASGCVWDLKAIESVTQDVGYVPTPLKEED